MTFNTMWGASVLVGWAYKHTYLVLLRFYCFLLLQAELKITDERIRDAQEATFAVRKAVDTAPGKVNPEKLFASFKSALDMLKNARPEYDLVFTTIESAFKKIEPGYVLRPVIDKGLLRVASLVGSKFTTAECPALTSTEALLYFWVFCRIFE